jgi:DNA-binding Lrp family transcriptional regulator
VVDEIDRILLVQLGKNSRASSYEITRYLQNLGYRITDRTVRHRLAKLEKSNVILGYSLLLNPTLLSEKINRTILLKFKYTASTSVMTSRLEKYDSNKIGNIVITGKPTITNDVINDKRIRYPEWAKRERLQSFGGYPLTHSHNVIGVLAMFSTKRLQAADFEILGVFSDQVSKELEGVFDAIDFLIPK